jgi:hypothetical protein
MLGCNHSSGIGKDIGITNSRNRDNIDGHCAPNIMCVLAYCRVVFFCEHVYKMEFDPQISEFK